MKKYNFRCGWNDNHNCKGNHIVELNDEFYDTLFYKIKEKGYDIGENFIDKTIKEFENGKINTNHFCSIDVGAELRILFIENKLMK